MTDRNRYHALRDRHQALEAQLVAEMARSLPRVHVVRRLTREKLLLKDEMNAWERLMGALRVEPEHGSGVDHTRSPA